MSEGDHTDLGVEGGAGHGQGVTVEATNQCGWDDLDLERWTRVATETLSGEQVDRGHLDLTFVDPEEMAELNEAHMGHAGPTDVLSFPLDDGDDYDDDDDDYSGDDFDGDQVPILLGDVVVCPSVAADHAAGHCGDIDSELTLLVIHGVLHILGHDHALPEEAAAMIEREQHHLLRYGIGHPGPQQSGPPT